MDLLFGTKNGGGMPKLIDNLWGQLTHLYRPEITLVTLNGTFSGELFERTPDMVVLKTNIQRKVMEGPNKGREICQYHYIYLTTIISLTVEAFKDSAEVSAAS